jgi:hypothetical protein
MGVLPSIWGPNLWGTLHLLCLAGTITPEFVQEFSKVIPCPLCSKHFMDTITENPLPETEDVYVLFKWSVFIHNLVNARIGKPIVEAEDALKFWNSHKQTSDGFDFKTLVLIVILFALISFLLRKYL